MQSALDNSEDLGFNPRMMAQVRRTLTDLLPMDITWELGPETFAARFDWRTYFCTFFDEQQQIDALEEPIVS